MTRNDGTVKEKQALFCRELEMDLLSDRTNYDLYVLKKVYVFNYL